MRYSQYATRNYCITILSHTREIQQIGALYHGKDQLNTAEYTTAFLLSDWLYFLWCAIKLHIMMCKISLTIIMYCLLCSLMKYHFSIKKIKSWLSHVHVISRGRGDTCIYLLYGDVPPVRVVILAPAVLDRV